MNSSIYLSHSTQVTEGTVFRKHTVAMHTYVYVCMYNKFNNAHFIGRSFRTYFWKCNFPMKHNLGLSVCRSVGLSVCRSVGLSVCRSVGLSVGQSVCLSAQNNFPNFLNVPILVKCRLLLLLTLPLDVDRPCWYKISFFSLRDNYFTIDVRPVVYWSKTSLGLEELDQILDLMGPSFEGEISSDFWISKLKQKWRGAGCDGLLIFKRRKSWGKRYKEIKQKAELGNDWAVLIQCSKKKTKKFDWIYLYFGNWGKTIFLFPYTPDPPPP